MAEQEVTVEKVGRKWAIIANGRYRIDIKTLRADGGNYCSPGTCYLGKDAFLEERETNEAWNILRQKIGYRPPGGVTKVDIQQATQLLKIDQ